MSSPEALVPLTEAPWNGVPENPEQDGWHVLRHKETGVIAPAQWHPARPLADAGWSQAWLSPDHMTYFYAYLGPVYTRADLAQAAREQAAAAEARVIAMRDQIEKWFMSSILEFETRASYFKSSAGSRSHCGGVAGAQDAARDMRRMSAMHTEALMHLRALPLPPTDALAMVIEEAKAEEREACAAQCERTATEFRRAGLADTARAVDSQAEAIRARGAAGTEGAR